MAPTASGNTKHQPSILAEDPFANYVSYQDPATDKPRIGHYDLGKDTIQPLSFLSGTPVSNLYQVIEAQTIHTDKSGSHVVKSGEPRPASSVKILAPLTGRDVLCVGKNYAEHAVEFNSSGFDSSDKVDQPSHPVIFTKRYTSIIGHGEEILLHPEFTQTVDYEGEIGVIIGKAGFRIDEKDALDHVWGYTIINDVTARERQRDHKQFYIGKSPDTFCPMGPIAVPVSRLEKDLRVQTRVNGELRQDATTKDLIFPIPILIKTMSEGQTLFPGDVLATGTPAGVGFGQKPPVYLQPGDEINVSVTGLGTLTNRVASLSTPNRTLERCQTATSSFFIANATRFPHERLIMINGKATYYRVLGKEDGPPILFVHGLGATSEYFTPLISAMNLGKKYRIHLYDFEGHGLSRTHPLSRLSVRSLASDLNGIFEHAEMPANATLIADSMGCLIALQFVLSHPGKISKLILLSPPPSPLPEALGKRLHERAETVRTHGISAIVDSAASSTEADSLMMLKPLALAARRISLLGQDAEGYAKACMAFGRATKKLGVDDAGADNVSTTSKAAKTNVLTVGEKRLDGTGFDLKSVYGEVLGEGEMDEEYGCGRALGGVPGS
ncbi:uncharacterized protein N0V89_005083 [Didymosphaeria variabile]|uniref:Fumarylacetoacetate hydrolase-like protein n=1 Tax=Didymosphaeria variabile TaxID=1932322 RepID=A0A9W8XMI0_9PLEO|nr:uncharacterized protein N0V89_005083 [Didymosphaeria variabile]KAJ4353355.1 hypothetical protein N0V89_005083 [Didymosphaeria variabile]